MEQISEINRPVCAKCGDPALTLLHGLWLCGPCLSEFCNKQEKLKQAMILEG